MRRQKRSKKPREMGLATALLLKEKIKYVIDNEIDNHIIRYNNGYIVYKDYFLQKENYKWLLYKNGDFIASFGLSASAMAYCVTDRAKNYMLAKNILEIDKKLVRAKNKLETNKQLLKSTNNQKLYQLLMNKITENIFQCNAVREELRNAAIAGKYVKRN